MQPLFDVITVGDATMDAFLSIHDASVHCHLNKTTCELCVKYGEKIPVDSCTFAMGGDACNVAVGIARLGLKSVLCAELGDDEFTLKINNGLAKENVDKRLVKTSHGTATAFSIGINFQKERTLFVQHVKRSHYFHFDDVTTQLVYLTSLGNEWEKAYATTLDFIKKTNARLILAPGTLQLDAGAEKLSDVLQTAEVLILNKEEGMKLATSIEQPASSTSEIKDLLIALQKLGPKTVVVTDGANGSNVLDEKGNYFFQKVSPVDIVEKTGAGDAYSTGFLAAILSGKTMQEAMLWGTVNAGSVVGKIGAQEGLLRREELLEKLGNNT